MTELDLLREFYKAVQAWLVAAAADPTLLTEASVAELKAVADAVYAS
jgi:hypothetical protein